MPATFGLGGGGGGGGAGTTQQQPQQPIDESTPWVAAGDGDLPLLKRALQRLELPLNASDSNGFTFVHAAAAYGQIETLRWLLSHNNDGDDSGAAAGGDSAMTTVDVNAKDTDGDTPLHHCDDAESARVLIEEGHADPYVQNNEGKTPLQVKEDELAEGKEDDDESDDDETENLRDLIQYLKGINKDEEMCY